MTRLRRTKTPNGHRLEASHVLATPAADAWDLLVDTQQWPDWSPVISGVESTNRRIQAGTSGRIRAPGVWLPFRVTSYDLDARRWGWRLGGLPGASHHVDALGENRCRVAFELPLSATGYAPVCLRTLERLEGVLADDEVER